ncbi:MAG TPA: type II secretion system F family protein [Syntrophobacteraceae bacterium]|nr:type II secretion system F family protein [Syntrophobacteraceae bacterium]
MGYFQYLARDASGGTHRGVMEALSQQDAARNLKSGRLYPVRIKAAGGQLKRRVPEQYIIRFFFDLSDLLVAGLPLDRALSLISSNQTNKRFQRMVQDLFESVQAGNDLSGALDQYRDVFGPLSAHMVRAGEASGTLGPILKRLAQYLEQRREFRQSMISSMIYPVMLLAVSLVSMVILLVYVIPKFAQVFHDLNQEVPFLTQVMVNIGAWLKEFGWIAPIALALGFWGGKYVFRRPAARRYLDKGLFRLSLSRYLILHSELTRFCRTVGTMLESGVPLLRALDLGREMIMNAVLRESIIPLHQEIKVGRSMSNFFRSHSAFPARMGTMLRIAEEQGNIGTGLLSLSEYFEKELQKTLQRIMALMGPLVILMTGGIMAVMVLSVFKAIFGINDIKF